jgi:hypothetical protein
MLFRFSPCVLFASNAQRNKEQEKSTGPPEGGTPNETWCKKKSTGPPEGGTPNGLKAVLRT